MVVFLETVAQILCTHGLWVGSEFRDFASVFFTKPNATHYFVYTEVQNGLIITQPTDSQRLHLCLYSRKFSRKNRKQLWT